MPWWHFFYSNILASKCRSRLSIFLWLTSLAGKCFHLEMICHFEGNIYLLQSLTFPHTHESIPLRVQTIAISTSYKAKSQFLYLRRLSSPVASLNLIPAAGGLPVTTPYIQTRFIHSVLCWIFSSTKTGAEKWRCVFVYQNGLPLKRNTLEHPSPDKRSPLTLWHSHVFLQITCGCFDSAVLCQCSGTRERSWAFSASLPFFFPSSLLQTWMSWCWREV